MEETGLRRLGKRALERVVVALFRVVSRLAFALPTGLALRITRLLFHAGYHLWPDKRQSVLANAAQVLAVPPDDPAVRRLAHGIYRSYAEFSLEILRLPHLPSDEPMRLMTDAPERGGSSFVRLFHETAAEGRSLIVVSGHIGSIDMLAGAFAAQGVPVYGVADDSAFPELLATLERQRARWGISVVPWRNLRQLFRVLRTPSVVGLVVDWGYREQDVPVRLFGAWTTLPAGPAVLAARTGAIVVPVVNRRLPDGRYEATHFPPIEVPDGATASIAAATQQIADALEQIIGAAPAQWYSFKRIWPETQDERAALAARAAAAGGVSTGVTR